MKEIYYKKITIFRAPNIAKLPETIEYKANQYLQGDSQPLYAVDGSMDPSSCHYHHTC